MITIFESISLQRTLPTHEELPTQLSSVSLQVTEQKHLVETFHIDSVSLSEAHYEGKDVDMFSTIVQDS